MVIVGEATPGPWSPVNDTEEMLGCGADLSAALAASPGMVARERAAVATAASTAAAARRWAGVRLTGGVLVMTVPFLVAGVMVVPWPEEMGVMEAVGGVYRPAVSW